MVSSPPEEQAMWDTVEENSLHLAHDLPCTACGHAVHRYLPCDQCTCTPPDAPGSVHL
jgi:hypothetical protein